MSAMASQIAGVSMFCLTVCSSADQRKHQSSASLAFVRGIHRWPMNSPHKGPVTCFLCFLLMTSLWQVPCSARRKLRKNNFMHVLELTCFVLFWCVYGFQVIYRCALFRFQGNVSHLGVYFVFVVVVVCLFVFVFFCLFVFFFGGGVEVMVVSIGMRSGFSQCVNDMRFNEK